MAHRAGGADSGFDVIVVDGFDEAGLPPALSSLPFYRDCRRRLAPSGVLVANVFSYDPRHDAVLGALAAAFDGRSCQARQGGRQQPYPVRRGRPGCATQSGGAPA
jgi:spermidine synthase